MKINFIDKFLYKLMFLTFILLFIVVLNNYSIISLENMKSIISQNINLTQVIKSVNGTFNIIDLGDNTIQVNKNDYVIEQYDNNKYLYKQKDKEVINQTLGNVIKIRKYNDLYNVLILDENNNYITYFDLKNINVKMYQIVKVNDVIGECSNLNSTNEYYYYFKLQINEG